MASNKPMKFKYEEEREERLDKYLAQQLDDLSRSKIVDLIKSKGVSVKGEKFVKPSYKLAPGSAITVDGEMYHTMTTSLARKSDLDEFGSSGDESVIVPEKIDLNIVHEDEDILVIDKPHGLVVHPGAGNYNGTLVNGVAYHFKENGVEIPGRVGLVHRLDKQVSGLMVIAKNNQALRFLSDQFSGENVNSSIKAGKSYWAVVEGDKLKDTLLTKKETRIQGYVFRSRSDRKKYEFDTVSLGKGKAALSYISIIKEGKEYSLLNVRIKTGRTHQIRTQLKYLGIPVLNDEYYGGKTIDKKGIGLRCVRLDFIHPKVYKKLSLDKLPEGEVESVASECERVEYKKEETPLGVEIE